MKRKRVGTHDVRRNPTGINLAANANGEIALPPVQQRMQTRFDTIVIDLGRHRRRTDNPQALADHDHPDNRGPAAYRATPHRIRP